MPVASSALVSDAGDPDTRAAVKPWTVTAVSLTAEQAVTLLRATTLEPLIAPGIASGEDLRFWSTALRFAAALVAAGRYVPAVVRDAAGFHARWVPFLQGGQRSLARLAAAAPRSALALGDGDEEGGRRAPETLRVAAFVEAMLDQIVRQAGALAPIETAGLHDHWLAALHPAADLLPGSAASLEAFAAQVRGWQRPVTGAASAPYRLTFRLEEPEDDAGPWHLSYLLQSNTDPSLLVPSEQAWHREALVARVLPEDGFTAREHLLLSLGQAASLFPPIEPSLRTSAPAGLDLDTRGAHDFLTQGAPALEQAGFGVLLPAWWTRGGTRIRLTITGVARPPRMKGDSGLTLDALTRFDFEVSLGGEKLTGEELLALAAVKEPLVRFRGRWVHVTAEEIRAALDVWRRKGQPLTAREVVAISLGSPSAMGALPLEGVRASGWLEGLLRRLEGEAPIEAVRTPAGFVGTLRPYQARGLSWLAFLGRWGFGACLADDMGLGKTVQTLALVQHLKNGGREGPVLLACPTSVIANWQKEAARFTPALRVLVHHGGRRSRGEDFAGTAREHDLVVSSYALLHRDLAHLGAVDWAGVVMDEAQNVKNSETLQARAARALRSGWRVALTGTPVENHVGDLWSLFEFLNPGLLGGEAAFKRDFFIPIQARRDGAAEARLKHLTGPFVLRRLKTDRDIVPDLPEKMEMKVFCTLTREQASLYAAVVKEATRDIAAATEAIERRGRVLAALSRLKQVCNHPAQFLGDNSPLPGRSGKLARLGEMLEEVLEVGERALVFTQFAVMGAMLKRHLQETFGREVLFLHGGVPRRQRDRMVERFQKDEDAPPFFVLSLKAGGTGLNLERANHVFHYDRWWNPAVEDQATDRAFRIGQARRVQVHKLVCAGTLEERIDEMISAKRGLAERVMGAGESWLTELSLDELRFVMALRPEAVAE